jgi:hypothetical protein
MKIKLQVPEGVTVEVQTVRTKPTQPGCDNYGELVKAFNGKSHMRRAGRRVASLPRLIAGR